MRRTRCTLGLVLGLLAAASAPVAQALPYHVVAEAQNPESVSRMAGLHANVAHPRALAVRLWARRNGRNIPGQVTARVICGHHWHRLTTLRGPTPFVKQVPFLRPSGLCIVDASAMAADGNRSYLHLVLLAR